jgi:hypothetical protein
MQDSMDSTSLEFDVDPQAWRAFFGFVSTL